MTLIARMAAVLAVFIFCTTNSVSPPGSMVLYPTASYRTRTRSGASIRVRVTDAAGGRPLPCRLTVVDARGELATVQVMKDPHIAARLGVIYTSTGEAEVLVPSGRHTIYATRGPTYSLASATVIAGDKPQVIDLRLSREVDTRGYVSCDTHVHTLTFSGHGDCTAEERMVTLAGEDIELPIATDHNTHTDYRPYMAATNTVPWFTPVIGNEVTTDEGHFNAFPIQPGSAPPDYRVTDWSKLTPAIRMTAGVRIIILNHPSNTHSGFCPTDPGRFHPVSGESLDGRDWAVDAMEVLSSGAQQSDWMKPFHDWFALLNRGRRITAIGASDSHDVNRYIVGQARTYIASSATRPDRIDVEEACANIKDSRALVSLGLMTDMTVDGRFHVGDLATGVGERLKVRIKVQAPRWLTADRIDLFVNGAKVESRPIIWPQGATNVAVELDLPRPRQDEWLVAIATGPGPTAPYWPIARPYRPTSAAWEPIVIGATNPIRIDGDGDGKFHSPYDYATSICTKAGRDIPALLKGLEPYDEVTATQAASICRAGGMDLGQAPGLEDAAPQVRQGILAYQSHFRPIKHI